MLVLQHPRSVRPVQRRPSFRAITLQHARLLGLRALFFATAGLLPLAACGDDEGTDNVVPPRDVGVETTDDVLTSDADTSPDLDDSPDGAPTHPDVQGDVPAPDGGADAQQDPFDLVEVGEPLPDVSERPDDWWCNLPARLAACDAPLLDVVAVPSDPNNLLYPVNRREAISAEWPAGLDVTWTPCDGTPPPSGLSTDLICLPTHRVVGSGRALRQLAWDSPTPVAEATTHDGLPVGHEGRIGFAAMFDAALAEIGIELFVASGYRSFRTQHDLHERYVRQEQDGGLSEEDARIYTSTYSAVPGHSEHQLGTTADLTYRTSGGSIFPGLDQAMGASRAFLWTYRNAHRFGIVMTYEAHQVESSQYVYEPWHYRFVGVEAADTQRRCQLNTQELTRARYDLPPLPDYAGFRFILEDALQIDGYLGALPGAIVAPGSVVNAGWRVRNTGSTNWEDLALLQVAGPTLDIAAPTVVCTIVGARVDLPISFTAPDEEGVLAATFVLGDGETTVQPPLDLQLRVLDAPGSVDGPRFLRIVDHSNATGGQDPGADIDAIVVETTDGFLSYAAQVISYTATPGSVSRGEPSAALGAPDAFYAWPDASVCSVSGGFVSLGGAGTLVLELGAPLQPGDSISALEVGGCSYGSGDAIADEVELQAGATADGPWIRLGRALGPVVTGSWPPE